jgi:HEAT repeat protein
LANFDGKLHERLLEELREEDGGRSSRTLAGLVTSRPSSWLLKRGTELLDSPAPNERILGTRMIRELPAPWASKAGSEILDRLDGEQDADVSAWFIRALGFLGATPALDDVLAFTDHQSAAVREAVADAISGCSADDLSGAAQNALIALARDSDAEVRFSAVFELGSWWQTGLHDGAVEIALNDASKDQERAVSRAARAALKGDDGVDPGSM